MVRKRSGERAELWRERLERQAQGPWSIAEFCRREGISQPSFYLWRGRLGQKSQPGSSKRQHTVTRRPARFVPVQVSAAASRDAIQLEWADGLRIVLPHDAPVELAQAAIAAARRGQRS